MRERERGRVILVYFLLFTHPHLFPSLPPSPSLPEPAAAKKAPAAKAARKPAAKSKRRESFREKERERDERVILFYFSSFYSHHLFLPPPSRPLPHNKQSPRRPKRLRRRKPPRPASRRLKSRQPSRAPRLRSER